jgi:hypothetical protein
MRTLANVVTAEALLAGPAGLPGSTAIPVAAQLQTAPQQTPLRSLQASIERTTRSVNATWGIYVKSLETGDFLPFVGDDVGMLEAPGKTVIMSIFTGNHFGSGEVLENAIGLVARDVADYFAYRP